MLRRSKMDMAAREVLESRISGLLEEFGAVDISERPTRNHWELYQLATFSLQAGWPYLAVLAMRNLEKPIQSAPFALWLTNVQTVALIESSLQSMANRDGTNQSVDLYLKQQMYSKVVASLEVRVINSQAWKGQKRKSVDNLEYLFSMICRKLRRTNSTAPSN